jgi:hypothetical protein
MDIKKAHRAERFDKIFYGLSEQGNLFDGFFFSDVSATEYTPLANLVISS